MGPRTLQYPTPSPPYHYTCRLVTVYTNGSKNAIIPYIVPTISLYLSTCDGLHEWVQERDNSSPSSYHSTCRLVTVYSNGSKNAIIPYIVPTISLYLSTCDGLHEWVQERYNTLHRPHHIIILVDL